MVQGRRAGWQHPLWACLLWGLALVLWTGLYACTSPPTNKGEEPTGNDTSQPIDRGSPDAGQTDAGGGPESQPEQPANDAPVTDGGSLNWKGYLEPTQIDDNTQLKVKPYTLPEGLKGEDFVTIYTSASVGTLIGTKVGLYRVDDTAGTLTLVNKGAVVGIAAWSDGSVVVARPDVLQLWDGTLQPTQLHKQLDGSPITTLFARKDGELWIGTENRLWRLEGDKLSHFDPLGGVRWLSALFDADTLLLQDMQGNFLALREENKEWYKLAFADEQQNLEQIAPVSGAKFWGLREGQLWLRKPQEGSQSQVAWWPFRIQADQDGKETKAVEAIVLDPKFGQTWTITAGDFFRISETRALRVKRPAELTGKVSPLVSNDGVLWAAGASKVYRIGQDGPVITYAKHIQPFFDKNCTRSNCHNEGGSAFPPLTTYAVAKAKVNRIITLLEQKRMPADKRPLEGGDVQLIRRWLEGGLLP